MAKHKKEAVAPMTVAQEFFLQNHPGLPETIAAAQSGATEAQVRAFRNRPNQPPAATAFRNALGPEGMPRPGVVAMTEAASAVSDDIAKRGAITQDQIDRAAAAGDYALADRLKVMREQKRRDAEEETRARNADRWHYIR